MQHDGGATLVFLHLVTAVAGKTTVAVKVDYETVVQSVGRNLDLSSVDSRWLNCQDCQVVVRIDEESHGIACAHVGKKDLDVGAGDECRASSSAGSCVSTRCSIRGGRRGSSCSGNRTGCSCTSEGCEEERHRCTGERVPRGQWHEAGAREVEWG